MKTIQLLIIILLSSFNIQSQDIIEIKNPSFEGEPSQGGMNGRFHLEGWWDCGDKGQSPPDIHASNSGFFNVFKSPADGNTFLGMLTRQSGTWEKVAQQLKNKLMPDNHYIVQLTLCRSDTLKSGLSNENYDNPTSNKFNFNQPIIVRIWGGTGYCNQKELLAESMPISNTEWMVFEFDLEPEYTASHIEIEAYFPTEEPCNGNVLLDNMSNIIRID